MHVTVGVSLQSGQGWYLEHLRRAVKPPDRIVAVVSPNVHNELNVHGVTYHFDPRDILPDGVTAPRVLEALALRAEPGSLLLAIPGNTTLRSSVPGQLRQLFSVPDAPEVLVRRSAEGFGSDVLALTHSALLGLVNGYHHPLTDAQFAARLDSLDVRVGHLPETWEVNEVRAVSRRVPRPALCYPAPKRP